MSAAIFAERADPGRVASAALAALMHLALLAVLIFGIQWQSKPPQAVTAEIWFEPAPVAEPKPLPKIEPPRQEPKPEPVIPKPDIAVKKVPEKAKPAVKPEPPKPVPRVDEARKRMREELAREQAALAQERERQQVKEQLARDAAAASRRGLAEYEGKIRAKVRGNVVLPPDLPGNPEAVFLVVQLPTGEVLSTKLAKSSGHRAYDEAVERAILKSSPLPKPDRPELFSRELRLTFRPRE